jgi:hypothetical protein
MKKPVAEKKIQKHGAPATKPHAVERHPSELLYVN